MIISIPGIVSQGGGFPSKGKPLNDYTWDEISLISQAGLAPSYWSVGERKSVAISGNVGQVALSGTYYCYILGFNHNSGIEGENLIHFQFGYTDLSGGSHFAFVDSALYGNQTTSAYTFSMTLSKDNRGGWGGSTMRTVICPAFKLAMPSDLQAVLKSVTKYSDNTGGRSTAASAVTATTDEIFLPSEFEVFGKRTYSHTTEQSYQRQYDFYSAGNSKERYKHNALSTGALWFLRSTNMGGANYFCSVNGSAVYDRAGTNQSYGFAPCFCV